MRPPRGKDKTHTYQTSEDTKQQETIQQGNVPLLSGKVGTEDVWGYED